MLLSPEVLTLQILNIIFLVFVTVSLFLSIRIFFKWDINATTKEQYKLEKQSFLAATIIKYILAIKLPLFLFFIFTLDKLSISLTGAMCAAGVVDATQFGTYLFILKIINIYLFGFWLIIHNIDIKNEKLPYTKIKFGFFIFIFFIFITEVIVEYLMFDAINIDQMVSCCGTLYSSSATSLISNIFILDTKILLVLFYGLFMSLFISYKFKLQYIFSISNFLFLIISIVSLISFFGTYIYELPTHHCPFCFLQKEYYYVGYFIYTLLFIGTFFGFVASGTNPTDKNIEKYYKISIIFSFLYLVLVSAYPIIFYIKNGVWL
ncbi:MAG: hypothetical protein HOF69_02165 [Campylobacteraceae bacterium]|jgi:hypothetical protein|nr:hypothetical protein [Campylobacteraceae bacterium]MBT3882050.1 hypothetical protein [Campylobacteraceae bacterium]MBT4030059.1 hypothetical protein [Campylobacteraceae bacterium]MBT4179588.1 hypothetical protein [Campylobacteraceae bacterium]MBT4572812.1 hypothetical protein [Campylobacteraceae bacterium]